MRVEFPEFANAVKIVETWGLKIEDPAATFKVIDADGGGKILFDEFAHWAIQNKLDLDDDDDADDAGEGSGRIETFHPKKMKVIPAENGGAPQEELVVDWAKVATKLPWDKDDDSSKRRKLLFRQFDPNGNGLLSLAEVDLGVVGALQMGDVICKAVLIRAFNAAKGTNQVRHGQ